MEDRRIRVCLLGASPVAGNSGLVALACGTLASVAQSLPRAEVFLVDYDRAPAVHAVALPRGETRVELVNLRYSKKLFLPNNIPVLLVCALIARLLPSEAARRWFLSLNPWLRKISTADMALSLAGGDSFSDIYGMNRLVYVSLPQLLVILLGKPLVQLPQTYGPYRRASARWMARFILKRSVQVFSRDQAGLETLRKLMPETRGALSPKFAYDMGFALTPQAPPAKVLEQIKRIRVGGPLVGLNISGLLYMGGYTRDNMFGLRCAYPRLVREVIDFLIRRQGAQVLLVPHVLSESPSPEEDGHVTIALHDELAGRYAQRLHCLDGRLAASEVKYVIGQCDFFVGSRMHACIAALSQGVPVVGLAYSHKFAGVLESVGGGCEVVDLREADEEAVLSSLSDALRDKESLRSELEERMPKIKESVLNLFARNEFKPLFVAQPE